MATELKKVVRTSRQKRKPRIQKKIALSDRHRLTVFKSGLHTYAQVVAPDSGKVLFGVSTLQKEVQTHIKNVAPKDEKQAKSTKSCHAARCVGLAIAEKCKAKSITEVVFNRNGHLYHGRIKAIADGAREGGLQF